MNKSLEILDVNNSWKLQNTILSNFIKEYFSGNENEVNILEAGCGKKWNLDLNGLDFVLTGIDISKEALEIRKYKTQDMDKSVIADIRNVKLNNAEFDVIYCKYVLEHIDGAEEVLDNFFKWLKLNGLLVLIIPDRDTVFGFVTRITPFWFHVFYKKYVQKEKNVGKPGHGPYPVSYDKVVSRRGINHYCISNGYNIDVEYGVTYNTKKSLGILSPLIEFLFRLIEVISIGKLQSNHTDLIYIINKSQ